MIRDLAVVVRSNLPPNIRPAAKQVPAQAEDEANEVSIAGQRGQCINLDHSQNYSASFTEKQAEQYRLYDKIRVSNPRKIPPSALSTPKGVEPQGLKQYVDYEVTHYIQYRNELGHLIVEKFRKPDHLPSKGIFVTQENLKRSVS